jgi:hypothetical protein
MGRPTTKLPWGIKVNKASNGVCAECGEQMLRLIATDQRVKGYDRPVTMLLDRCLPCRTYYVLKVPSIRR